jgi:hypothetical protein
MPDVDVCSGVILGVKVGRSASRKIPPQPPGPERHSHNRHAPEPLCFDELLAFPRLIHCVAAVLIPERRKIRS